MANDWLPSKRAEQLVMAKTWVSVLAGSGTSWDVSGEEQAELYNLMKTAEVMFEQAVSMVLE